MQNHKKTKHKLLFRAVTLVLLLVIYLLLNVIINFSFNSLAESSLIALIIVFSSLSIKELVHLKIRSSRTRNNLYKLILIVSSLLIIYTFRNHLVALGISLGVIAAILTFAFQPIILSFIGWVYLLTHQVYREGDRIRIGEIKGDVMKIDPLHTKILEVGSEYIRGDFPSGRVFTMPNGKLLTDPVANYSKYFPYIWTEITFQLTYDTDFQFAIQGIKKIIKEHFSKNISKIKTEFEELLEDHDFDDEHFQAIRYTFLPAQSWIDFRITFPVIPKKKGVTISRLTEKVLEFFDEYPEKIAYPKGRAR
ncbi:mechanosensitive ion channel [Candidatus Peregrinibacteria bacterium]|nr:mechanosensitive ion channel [Candidatus Peregrinibacteria bacterium]